jgi:hypothetical protein
LFAQEKFVHSLEPAVPPESGEPEAIEELEVELTKSGPSPHCHGMSWTDAIFASKIQQL